MDNPVKIDANIDSKGTNKLIDAVVDTFSPATELMGLLGDAVRLARTEVAVRITVRAKHIADEANLTLTAPPLKFLVPFYEKASLETPDDVEAHERWAQLLVSASIDEIHPRFVWLMSQIEGPQAKLMREIFLGNDAVKKADKAVIDDRLNSIIQTFTPSIYDRLIQKIVSHDAEDSLGTLLDSIDHFFQGQGVILRYLSLSSVSENSFFNSVANRDISELDKIDLEILTSTGMFSKSSYEVDLRRFSGSLPYYLKLETVFITDLGISFLSAFDPIVKSCLEDMITNNKRE